DPFQFPEMAQINMKEEQKKDRWIKEIIDVLEDKVPRPTTKQVKLAKNFILKNEILYHKMYVEGFWRELLVIPKEMRLDVLFTNHAIHYSGHLGFRKTLSRIKTRYFFKDMIHYVEKYVRSCPECQAKNPAPTGGEGLLHPIYPPDTPMSNLTWDVLGPLKETLDGNKYIVVLCDTLTRWIEAAAIKDQKAHTVADFLVKQVFMRHSFPRAILSDRGKNFMSNLVSEVLKLVQVQAYRTTGFHPQTNAQSERSKCQNLQRVLAKYIDKDHLTWDRSLPMAVFALNTSVHSVTGVSPFYALYGRHPTLPQDIILPIQPVKHYTEDLAERLRDIHAGVIANTERHKDYSVHYYDEGRREVIYEIDAKVLVYIPNKKLRRSTKLLSFWEGPYRVVTKIGPVTYRLTKCSGKSKAFNCHVSRMKPYFGRQEITLNSDSDSEEEFQQDLGHIEDTDRETVTTSKAKSRAEVPRAGVRAPPVTPSRANISAAINPEVAGVEQVQQNSGSLLFDTQAPTESEPNSRGLITPTASANSGNRTPQGTDPTLEQSVFATPR